MFLMEKRDGNVKVGSCVDGRKHREGSQKKYTTSPKMALESVLIASSIEVQKKRDVDVVNIPRSFLTAAMEKDVIIVLQVRLAELMVNTKLIIYQKLATIEYGRALLYIKLQKAIYGCLRSALLFYENLVSDLKSRGFIINQYNTCVANMTVNGKQITITWHVDDLKILHVDTYEVTKLIDWMKGIYGSQMRDHVGRKKLPRNGPCILSVWIIQGENDVLHK